MAQTKEQNAESKRRGRAKKRELRALEEKALLLSNPVSKEAARELPKQETLASMARWIEALKKHWHWIGLRVGEAMSRVERLEQRIEDVFSLMGQLADQNALLRDQLARERWRVDQLEARFGLMRAALTDGAPMLTSLNDVLEDLRD